jgi:hypothetical protein
MEGNRFTHLWGWFANLMKRRPDEIPAKIWPIRQATMFIALAIGVWASALGLLSSVRLGALGTNYGYVAAGLGLVAGLMSAFPRKALFLPSLAGGLVILGAGALVAWLLWGFQWQLICFGAFTVCAVLTGLVYSGSKLPPQTWGEGQPSVRKSWTFWASIAALMLIGTAGLLISAGKVFEITQGTPANWLAFSLLATTAYLIPQLFFENRRAPVFNLGLPLAVVALAGMQWLGGMRADPPAFLAWTLDPGIQGVAMLGSLAGLIVFGILAWMLSRTFLVPVMADSARMFSNSPVNIPNQNRIRVRGLELLKDLHDPGRDAKHRYDRIIILAHSLGTVVAYRLISHYWGTVYEQITGKAEAAAVDDAAKTGDIVKLRKAVRAYGAAVSGADHGASPWKITDFVTIGSPLTYGALLMEESNAEFIKQRDGLKRYPTSPPQALDARLDPLKLFKSFNRPHHASLFAATCWTNLYFPAKGLAEGDLVGGPLGVDLGALGYGKGVLDVNLGHDASVSGFTHGEYWRWPNRDEHRLLPGNGTPGAGTGPFVVPHVAAIRDALCLFGDYDAACGRLLDPVGSYPNFNFR